MKKKSYKVVTFEQLRQQLREAQEKAKQQAKAAEQETGQPSKEEPQVEVDFDLKESGQKRAVAGYDCREVVMTVTVRQKGKTLEEAGGMVLVSNSWLAPEITALREEMKFDQRYAQQVYGEVISVEAMQQMAAAMAMYPGMKDAIERMSKESVNMSGSPLLTTMTFQMVKGKEQLEQEKREGSSNEAPPTSVGGLLGGFGRKMAKKPAPPQPGAADRATIMTSTSEVLQISTDVAANDVSLPAGFKESR
jgi:hypothetical protein